IFEWDEINEWDMYKNGNRQGTAGTEFELMFKLARNHMRLNYAFYYPIETIAYHTARNKSANLALAPHQFSLAGSFIVYDNFRISPSAYYFSPIFGDTKLDNEGEPVTEKMDPIWALNLYLSYEHIFIDNLTLGIGCFDLLGTRSMRPQPYHGYHAPFASEGRTLLARLVYDLSL
ncbi:MAG: hypothetical protein HQK83_19145, partial [Fibrobacteria bacterium]|nr:hypothetical protein [Fibrobacteria bacterium]